MQTDLIEECAICGKLLDSNEPGHFKSPDERFRHSICHERGTIPIHPVTSTGSKLLTYETGTDWERVQYNCGHYGKGEPSKLPDQCPECNDPQVITH